MLRALLSPLAHQELGLPLLLLFVVAFVVLVARTWRKSNQSTYEHLAMMPLKDEPKVEP